MDNEKRIFDVEKIEVRSGEDGKKTIDGYAAVYNQFSRDLGGFIEVIEPGFFDSALGTDTLSLWNHNVDKPLGRKSNGTLEIKADERGLHTITYPPDTTWGRDAVVSVGRGDVKQMSFSFNVRQGGDKWTQRSDGTVERRLLKDGCKELFDVSPTALPAYTDTETHVSSRAMDKLNELTNSRAADNDNEPKNDGVTQARHANRKRQLDILKRK